MDLIGTYTANAAFNVKVGYCHFFIGDYIRDSLGAGNSTDANFVYVQFLFFF